MKTSQASSTALLIARAVVLAAASRTWRPLLVGDSAALTRRLLSAAGGLPWSTIVSWRIARRLLFAFERWWSPGVLAHWLVRKRLIDEFARDALAGGCRQIVVLGAGLDTLGQRFCGEVACFELDHPATQALKRAAFRNGPTLLALELVRGSPAAALRAEPRFEPAAPAFYLAEGLFMYLAQPRVGELLRELAEFSAPGSRFAFTFLDAPPGQPLGFAGSAPLTNCWLRWKGEPFRWGLARERVESFAAGHGWTLTALPSPEEMRGRFLVPHGLGGKPLATGESVAYTRLQMP